MLARKITGIDISAIASILPSGIANTEFFAQLYGEKESARVTRGTGISSIRHADGITTTELIHGAVEHLLANYPIDRKAIDGLVVVTQTPDTWSPGTAFSIHHLLELDENCFIVDINAGCSGYVNGLIQAASLIASEACLNVLLCTGDVNTRLVDDREHQLRMLFGDAATATLLGPGTKSLQFIYGADGSGRGSLGVPLTYEKTDNVSATVHSLKMDGMAVMSFALHRVPQAINSLLEEMELAKDDVDLFALHQPNEFIVNYIRNSLGVDKKVLPVDVDEIGNTNSSSIPLLLSRRNWDERESRRHIVLSGFGVGLSWNALHLDLSGTKIIKPVVMGSSSSG
ncbi:ketoacyl-ACP synthase III [Salmonella enterica subsp. enterica serovar Eastbourne]|nr:ketoacyl-ACP synthase III [Salmonella enterica subsp. enterica serovar Eastbourne]EHC5910046.1 ketoacyl-ACP synthase III [Salmonella enterica subsp. enterica serovar Eastbourne]